jgi:dextranase
MKKITQMNILTCLCLFAGCLASCSGEDSGTPDEIFKVAVAGSLSTDKARYAPNEAVTFTLERAAPTGSIARYRHLNTVVAEEPVSGKSWTWTPPATDFKGYLVEVYNAANGQEKIIATTAVDVSGDWTRFPRYGFLSGYNAKTPAEINAVIDNLNRHHINGIQYYDWLHDHHRPLAGTPAAPADTWLDLIGRTNTRATTEGYLAAAKSRNIAAMWYDLCFGALDNAADDGVQEEWYLFKNSNHTTKDNHALSAPFRSSIYLTNPANAGWLDYFSARVKEVYDVYDFDGFHIDQLGSRGTLYAYNGVAVNLPEGFKTFIQKMAADFPTKKHAFNAVSEYGQEKIAQGGVNFFYNEIWGEKANYADLKTIRDNNYSFNPDLNCVYAAYMNYDLGKQKGTFNTPGVLMTDAVIFAVGAAHIELGEHILDNEYFPNDNLQPDNTLKAALIRYYDFMVAYQNILRDGGDFNTVAVNSAYATTPVAAWAPQTGKIISLPKKVNNRQVIHLFNFMNATHLQWRDLKGTQAEPRLLQNVQLEIAVSQPVQKVWAATPDREGKMYEDLTFETTGSTLTVMLPALKYWTMVVVE